MANSCLHVYVDGMTRVEKKIFPGTDTETHKETAIESKRFLAEYKRQLQIPDHVSTLVFVPVLFFYDGTVEGGTDGNIFKKQEVESTEWMQSLQ